MALSDETNFGCLSWIFKVIRSIRKTVLKPAPISPLKNIVTEINFYYLHLRIELHKKLVISFYLIWTEDGILTALAILKENNNLDNNLRLFNELSWQ